MFSPIVEIESDLVKGGSIFATSLPAVSKIFSETLPTPDHIFDQDYLISVPWAESVNRIKIISFTTIDARATFAWDMHAETELGCSNLDGTEHVATTRARGYKQCRYECVSAPGNSKSTIYLREKLTSDFELNSLPKTNNVLFVRDDAHEANVLRKNQMFSNTHRAGR